MPDRLRCGARSRTTIWPTWTPTRSAQIGRSGL